MGLLKELASRVETPPGEETDPDPKSAKVRAEATGADGAAAARAGLDYFKARAYHDFVVRVVSSITRAGWFIASQYLTRVGNDSRAGSGPRIDPVQPT